jgi:nitroreductase
MTILDTIFSRRSIRKYQERAVEEEKVERLLQAAMAAPSANNSRPWEFVVVRDLQVLADIRSALLFGRFDAPVAIIVCGNISFFKRPLAAKFWVQDCSAATENILLAAIGEGLGTVWCGVHPVHNFEKRIAKILHLPDHVKPLNVIYVGYPAEEIPARTQFDPERVHRDHY